ncbi:MAG: MFS transporter [Hyphomicrobiales bacterium]|nr:MFS transporter [Hyphomicrobiales bacterium]
MHDDSAEKSFFRRLISDRRIGAMLGLGFSSGLPYLLVYSTQAAWLSEAKVPIETIGLMSELTMAYKFKFLWAPFLDQYDAPIFGKLLGRRRGWIVVAQIGVMAALAGIAFGDPAHWLWWTIGFSLALGFAGATQDVVIDGWRITVAPAEQQAMMSAYAQTGYRIAILCAGAGALYLSDRIGWRGAYLFMAALMAPGVVAAFMAPEPDSDKVAAVRKERPDFATAVVAPIKEMLMRLGPPTIPILVMIAVFRMPDYISGAMAMPLYKSLHYTNTDIATVTKLFGFWVALAGIFVGGYVTPRLGMMPSLMLGTVAASSSHLCFAYLAAHGGDFATFAVAVSIENFAAAFASTVLIAYMSSLTSASLAASQYALLTSLYALPGSLIAGLSGFMVKAMGFERFFMAAAAIGIPVAALCLYVWRLHAKAERSALKTQSAAPSTPAS